MGLHLTTRLWLIVTLAAGGCDLPEEVPVKLPGASCVSGLDCVRGELCVPLAEDSRKATGVCEPYRLPYTFLIAERHSSSIDHARATTQGHWELPRQTKFRLETERYPMTQRNGKPLRCRDESTGKVGDCWVPRWSDYYGRAQGGEAWVMPNRYDRFYFFALRHLRHLMVAYQFISDAELTGGGESTLSASQIRQNIRNTMLATIDSFVERGIVPFALERDPDTEGRAGHQNPNRSWAPTLDQWDPTFTDSWRAERMLAPRDFPGVTYSDLRKSLWDIHGAGFRAQMIGQALQTFRHLLTDEQRRMWMHALIKHAEMLSLPSAFEPDDNHGITQGLGLLYLGRLLAGEDPELLPASVTNAWLHLGRARLNACIQKTVSVLDGVQKEQSPFYHNYQLSFLLEVQHWLEAEGMNITDGVTPNDELPAARRVDYDPLLEPERRDLHHLEPSSDLDLERLVDQMMRFSTHVTQPSGLTPLIGSSVVQNFPQYQKHTFSSVGDAGGMGAQAFTYVRTRGRRGTPPETGELVQVFEQSGFVTARSDFSVPFERQTQWVLNTGAPAHSHSHLDALSLHLFGGGSTVLADSGWFSYTRPERHYFDSTRAHNTVTVDQLNQCSRAPYRKVSKSNGDEPLPSCDELADEERHLKKGDPGWPSGQTWRGRTSNNLSKSPAWAYQSGLHGLYRGVTHRRGVFLVDRNMVLVVDRLDAKLASGAHEYLQTWHLPLGFVELKRSHSAGADRLAFGPKGGKATVSLHVAELNDPPTVDVVSGVCHDADCKRPAQGFIAVSEGVMKPALAVEVTKVANSASFVTVILLGEWAGWRPRIDAQVDRDSATIEVALDNGTTRSLRIKGFALGENADGQGNREQASVK